MTPDAASWGTLLVAAATLATMPIRPRGISEAWAALAGAIGMVLIGVVSPGEIPAIFGETSDVLLFLLGMMLITGIVDRAGVFDVIAEWCAAASRGNGRFLYILIFLLGAVVTAVLSLDVTVIMLTPIVYAVTRRRGLDPLPFMFACAFVANTASLAFPVSNLTNLLLYEQLGLTFSQFAAVMWFPNLVAMLTNLALFLWLFRTRIPRRLPVVIPDETASDIPALKVSVRSWQWTIGFVLIFALGALFLCGLVGWPLWWAALAGAGISTILAVGRRQLTAHQMVRDVAWPLFVFVVSMTVLVRGVEQTWLHDLRIEAPTSTVGTIMSGVLAGATGSNMINNVPMTVLASSVLERMPEAQQSIHHGLCRTGRYEYRPGTHHLWLVGDDALVDAGAQPWNDHYDAELSHGEPDHGTDRPANHLDCAVARCAMRAVTAYMDQGRDYTCDAIACAGQGYAEAKYRPDRRRRRR